MTSLLHNKTTELSSLKQNFPGVFIKLALTKKNKYIQWSELVDKVKSLSAIPTIGYTVSK